MSWVRRARSLPVRGKLLLTVLGAAVAALGASTYLSFRYWENEALASAQRQALLAAASTQATLESAIRLGKLAPAHHALTRLREEADVTLARVYGPDGRILLSADAYEEGTRAGAVFIPDAAELPRSGIVRASADREAVRAYLPVAIPEAGVLEVEFSVAPTMAAMERGARLGMGLMAVSLLAVGIVVVTMFEREVVAPLHRMDVLLRASADRRGADAPRDELHNLERSVAQLLEKERAVQAQAVDQGRQLAAREGLAQVGELAAEMAHEFKRPLASIRTAMSVLQQEYELDDGGREVLKAVDGQLERLHETMQDLFSLAKPLVMEEGAVEIAEVLNEALSELVGTPGIEKVEVHRAYAPGGIHVPGDGRRLRQAFLNVMANGVEAMTPEGGHLTLAMQALPGPSVEVSITDTGYGLEPDQVQKALSPFYSTKPLGTGLGLPLVARIVAAHGGGLAIESRPKRGTTVRITLPVVASPGAGRA
ncbi:MAG TPA: ATP-binding protein [Longimicrobiales bacterium]|nr:ATP-binding protein [Longimicrobiales bacterium]